MLFVPQLLPFGTERYSLYRMVSRIQSSESCASVWTLQNASNCSCLCIKVQREKTQTAFRDWNVRDYQEFIGWKIFVEFNRNNTNFIRRIWWIFLNNWINLIEPLRLINVFIVHNKWKWGICMSFFQLFTSGWVTILNSCRCSSSTFCGLQELLLFCIWINSFFFKEIISSIFYRSSIFIWSNSFRIFFHLSAAKFVNSILLLCFHLSNEIKHHTDDMSTLFMHNVKKVFSMKFDSTHGQNGSEQTIHL